MVSRSRSGKEGDQSEDKMKVVVKEEFRKAESQFNALPKEEREGAFVITCADLLPGKEYEVLETVKHGWYRIVDESGEDYTYPPQMFEIVEE